MRILGVDYGVRKIGIALGDTDLKVAGPLEVWEHNGDEEALVGRLLAFANREAVEAIVVGIPKKRSGEDTKQGLRHRRFSERLRSAASMPVVEVDESFTSAESRRLQEETGTDAPEDALAAMLILEEYFETLA